MTKLAIARGPELIRDPRLPNTLAACLASRVAQWPDGRFWSYRPDGDHRCARYTELWERSARIAAALIDRGATPGRPVVLLVRDVIDFVPAFWGCIRAGCMAVPLASVAANPFRTEREALLRRLSRSLDQPIVLADSEFAEIAKFICREARGRLLTLDETDASAPVAEWRPASSPVCLVMTSGSTGRPKLVALDEDTILRRSFTTDRSGSTPDRTTVSIMPPDGSAGMAAAYLKVRSFVHLPFAQFAVRPTALLDAIEAFGAAHFGMTNTLASRLLEAADATDRVWNLATLRTVGFGSEPIVPSVVRSLYAFLAKNGARELDILLGFGTTETFLLTGGSALESILAEGAPSENQPLGRCCPGVELRIVNNANEVLAERRVGKIEVRCPQTMFQGYWGSPDGVDALLTADGWYSTGDLGSLRDGVLTVTGRSKEIIINNGSKHSLVDIERHAQAVLGRTPVYACAARWPTEPAESLAIVVMVPDGDAEAASGVASTVRGAVGRRFGLQPRVFAFGELGQIPTTPGGKTVRRELAKRVLQGEFEPEIKEQSGPIAATPARPDQAQLAAIWRSVLRLEGPIDLDADFFELGGDSLASLNLSTRIRETFGLRLSAEDFFREPTFARLLSLIEVSGRTAAVAGPSRADVPWPLPNDLLDPLLSLLGDWRGHRPTRSKLVAGLNTEGGRPPLFWICQKWNQCELLGRGLGPEQPVYGLRSGAMLIDYSEDDIQRLALRYVHEIVETHPAGPVFVGGACQGGIIALAVAQHLLRRGRHVPLLILSEWHFQFHHYAEKVLLIYGRDTDAINPYRCFADPEKVWRGAFRDYAIEEIPCAHRDFFVDPYASMFSSAIGKHLAGSLSRPPLLPARQSCQAELSARFMPDALGAGEARDVEVEVGNGSSFDWTGAPFGLFLRSRWRDEAGSIVGEAARTLLPAIVAGGSHQVRLPIVAPDRRGTLQFEIAVVDEGNTWRIERDATALRFAVRIEAEQPLAMVHQA